MSFQVASGAELSGRYGNKLCAFNYSATLGARPGEPRNWPLAE